MPRCRPERYIDMNYAGLINRLLGSIAFERLFCCRIGYATIHGNLILYAATPTELTKYSVPVQRHTAQDC